MPRLINEISIRFIPHEDQRYETAGDWFYEDDKLVILVSRTKDPRHQQLVAKHELDEALMCNNDDVTQEAVDRFDMGPGRDFDDPGNSVDAPYHRQHMIATAMEHVMASAMGVDWAEYEDALNHLGQ